MLVWLFILVLCSILIYFGSYLLFFACLSTFALTFYTLTAEEQVSPFSEYMPSPEALIASPADEAKGPGYLPSINPMTTGSPQEVCETKGCVHAGKLLLLKPIKNMEP